MLKLVVGPVGVGPGKLTGEVPGILFGFGLVLGPVGAGVGLGVGVVL